MKLHATVLLAGGLLLSGCVVDQKLGETVGDSEAGSDGGSGDASSASVADGGSQSNTSAQPSTDSASASGTDDVGSASDDGTSDPSADDGSTGTPPDECPLGPDSVRLEWEGAGAFEPIPGVEAQFAIALAGSCSMLLSEDPGQPADEHAFDLVLECGLEGRVDATPITMPSVYTIQLEMFSAGIDPATLPLAGNQGMQEVELRLAADFWGMGWGVWFVVTRPDGTILLDVVSAPYISPTEPGVSVSETVLELLGGEPWHGDLYIDAVPSECETFVDKCGGVQHTIELGWNGTAQTAVEVAQLGTVNTDIEETWYRANVQQARAYPRPTCTDLPEADYTVAVWAEEP